MAREEKKFRCNKHKEFVGNYQVVLRHTERDNQNKLSRIIDFELAGENLLLKI